MRIKYEINPVRCKECRHGKPYPFADGFVLCKCPENQDDSPYIPIRHEAWTCSHAERKENVKL